MSNLRSKILEQFIERTIYEQADVVLMRGKILSGSVVTPGHLNLISDGDI